MIFKDWFRQGLKGRKPQLYSSHNHSSQMAEHFTKLAIFTLPDSEQLSGQMKMGHALAL